MAAVFSPKVATENSPPVSGRANSKLQIFGIGAVAGNKPDALKEMRQGQSGEGIEGDRFDPRLTKRGAEHIGYRAEDVIAPLDRVRRRTGYLKPIRVDQGSALTSRNMALSLSARGHARLLAVFVVQG